MEMYQRQNSACVREQYAPRHARHARSIARTRHASASRSAAAGSAPMSRGVPAGQSSPASGFGCWRGASRGAMAVRRRRSHIAGISRAAGCGADRCESQRAVRRAAPPLCRRLPRRPAPRAALRPQRALRACAVAEPRPRRPTRALPFPFPCVGPGSCDQRKRSAPAIGTAGAALAGRATCLCGAQVRGPRVDEQRGRRPQHCTPCPDFRSWRRGARCGARWQRRVRAVETR